MPSQHGVNWFPLLEVGEGYVQGGYYGELEHLSEIVNSKIKLITK